jgi:hypothetical protein
LCPAPTRTPQRGRRASSGYFHALSLRPAPWVRWMPAGPVARGVPCWHCLHRVGSRPRRRWHERHPRCSSAVRARSR